MNSPSPYRMPLFEKVLSSSLRPLGRGIAFQACFLAACLGVGGCSDDGGIVEVPPAEPCVPDETAPVPAREAYDTWVKVEPPGTACSDGSQYKFFVQYSQTSNNVLVLFEFGASCWDDASCSECGLSSFCESASLKGTTNTFGIDDLHVEATQSSYAITAPWLGDGTAFAGWNKVFIPYCTGDMQMGSRIAQYFNAEEAEAFEYRHVGHQNMLAVSAHLDTVFPTVPRLAVVGLSSGGIAAQASYHLLRNRMQPQCGYLINDSGPLFSSTGASGSLHQAWRDGYDMEPLFASVATELGPQAADALRADLGSWSGVLARAYPSDRFVTAMFQRDLKYLFFSYDSVTAGAPFPDLLTAWEADLAALRASHDMRMNMAYYMPYFRVDHCSHGLLGPPLSQLDLLTTGQITVWHGTDIAADGIDMGGYLHHVVNDAMPLNSHLEQPGADGEFGDDGIVECRATGSTMVAPLPATTL